MNSVRWLRISSIISVLFAAGHTLGGRESWSVGPSDALTAMRTYRFPVMGVSRTYLDFYRGFGFTLSVLLFMQAVVLWQLSAIARSNPRQVRPIIGTFTVAMLMATLIAWLFIFPVPVIFSGVLTACLAAAFVAAGRTSTKNAGNAASHVR